MFTIGEFSRFAQVSTDLLRYYDKLNLFKPVHTDKFTGYRYYKVEQLTDLNRILALKDLGLSLEQVSRLVHEDISTDEIRGMLTLQKLKAEEAIRDEIARLRRIESRLEYLEHNGSMPEYDVITKSTKDEHWLSIPRSACPHIDGETFFYGILEDFSRLLPTQGGYCVCKMNALEMETEDWSMGFVMADAATRQLTVMNDLLLTLDILPGADLVASVSFHGDFEGLPRAYNAVGAWINEHKYQMVGTAYEIFYQIDPDPLGDGTAGEIQIPIRAPLRYRGRKGKRVTNLKRRNNNHRLSSLRKSQSLCYRIIMMVILTVAVSPGGSSQAQSEVCVPYHSLPGDEPATIVVYDERSDTMITVNPRRAAQRFEPYSTFKIFNALVALDTGAMPDVEEQIDYNAELYPLTNIPNTPQFDQWRQAHNLRTGMQFSVIWFYTEVARKIGPEAMQSYLDAVPYGNADSSAWIDGVPFWLGNGLEISAYEQIDFLRRLLNDGLPFAERSMIEVRNILVLEETDGYRFSGKTGSSDDGSIAWFVGYIQTDEDVVIFALNSTADQRNTLKDKVVNNILACGEISH